MKIVKKTIILAICAFAGLPVFSQTPGDLSLSGPINTKKVQDSMMKGNRYLGLNGSWVYANGVINSHGALSVTAQGGYFVANRLITGLQLTYQTDNFQTKDGGASLPTNSHASYRYKYYVPEVFARYYITSFKVKPIAQLSAGWSFRSGTETDILGKDKGVSSNKITAGAAIGLGWLAAKNISVELLYNRRLGKMEFTDDVTKFRVGVSVLIR